MESIYMISTFLSSSDGFEETLKKVTSVIRNNMDNPQDISIRIRAGDVSILDTEQINEHCDPIDRESLIDKENISDEDEGPRILQSYEIKALAQVAGYIDVLQTRIPAETQGKLTQDESEFQNKFIKTVASMLGPFIDNQMQISNQQYRNYIENAPVSIFVADEQGNYIYVNEETCRMLDYTREELLNMSFKDIVPPEKRGSSLKSFAELKEKGFIKRDRCLCRKDGSPVDFNMRAIKLDDGHFLAFCTDIRQRKKAERNLIESEKKFRAYIDNSPTGIFVADGQGNYTEVNKAACQITGYSREELLSMNLLQLACPEALPEYEKHFKNVTTQGRFEDELPFIKKDGERGYWAVYGLKLSNDQFIASTIETTQRKLAEDNIKHLVKVLKAIRNVNQLIVKERDPLKLIQTACKELTDTRGYSFAWAAIQQDGKSFLTYSSNVTLPEHIKGKIRSSLPECIECASNAGVYEIKDKARSCKNCIFTSLCSDKVPIIKTLEHDNVRYGHIGVCLSETIENSPEEKDLLNELGGDISYALYGIEKEKLRLAAEEELKDNEIQFRTIVEQAGDAIFANDLEGRILLVNEMAIRNTGYSKEELLEMNVGDIDPNVISDDHQHQIWEKLGMNQRMTIESIHRRKDGTTYPVQIKLARTRMGKQNLIMALTHNLTEQKIIEKQMLDARINAEEASRMKSEFLSNMSHELRTPLNSVIGFSDILSNGLIGDLTDRQKKYINNINKSGKKLLELINNILELSRIESGRMKLNIGEVNIRILIIDVLLLTGTMASKKDILLDNYIDDQIPLVKADAEKIRDVLYNLIENAIKFTPSGGSVHIGASLKGDKLEIKVADTGIGISDKDKERIFRPFEQADGSTTRKYGGTGLGLMLVKEYVNMHNGDIWLKSHPGEGTEFTFTIPIQTIEGDN